MKKEITHITEFVKLIKLSYFNIIHFIGTQRYERKLMAVLSLTVSFK